MKVWSTLALFASLAAAASIPLPDSVDAVLERRQVRQPYKYGGTSTSAAVPVPEDAPADYHTAIGNLTENHSTSIQQLQRRDNSRKPRDPVSANDFYECATTVRGHLAHLSPSPLYSVTSSDPPCPYHNSHDSR